MICVSYCFFCCCLLDIVGMRSDDVCLVVELDVKMPWFYLLLCTNHTHTYAVATGIKARS